MRNLNISISEKVRLFFLFYSKMSKIIQLEYNIDLSRVISDYCCTPENINQYPANIMYILIRKKTNELLNGTFQNKI